MPEVSDAARRVASGLVPVSVGQVWASEHAQVEVVRYVEGVVQVLTIQGLQTRQWMVEDYFRERFTWVR